MLFNTNFDSNQFYIIYIENSLQNEIKIIFFCPRSLPILLYIQSTSICKSQISFNIYYFFFKILLLVKIKYFHKYNKW